jgi:hypothetical protein
VLEAEERKKCVKNGNANYKKERGKTSEVKTDERANQGEQNHGITLVTFFHYGQIVVFKNVFDVNIPNTSELGRYIEKRHDLVHRNGNSVDDRTLRYVDITDKILQDLILVVDTFVDHLMDALVLPIEKWNEGFESTGH